jgi:aspartyl-tRNA(Asn)/glutamyl-tRNA(Gln) amidotransferase subunit A
MARTEILSLGVAELARRLDARTLSSVEATDAVLTALAKHGPGLNALARLYPEAALAAAKASDERRARGEARGPLDGVPLAHKDMFHRAGELAEYGSLLCRDRRPTTTAAVIARLDAAGSIDCGRLNMVEFALGITGHNAHTGHPKNAWDPSRITGGSTSGGATAIAARLIPATLGSDTGGSIRIPASLCGLFGIKPTYGRVSRYACMPLSFSLDHIGPLARHAEDCALILGTIAGHDPNDPTTSRRRVEDYVGGIGRSLAGFRVAQVVGDLGQPVDDGILAVCEGAMSVFRALAAIVGEVALPSFSPLNAARRAVMLGEAAAIHRSGIANHLDAYNPQTAQRMLPGFALSASDYVQALAARGPILERFCAAVFADADLVALPTSPMPTPGIEETDTGGDAHFIELANKLGGLVGPFNYLGLPAISIPAGFDANGMPVGLQLVGRPFSEALLLRAAHAFERETGITAHTPPDIA